MVAIGSLFHGCFRMSCIFLPEIVSCPWFFLGSILCLLFAYGSFDIPFSPPSLVHIPVHGLLGRSSLLGGKTCPLSFVIARNFDVKVQKSGIQSYQFDFSVVDV